MVQIDDRARQVREALRCAGVAYEGDVEALSGGWGEERRALVLDLLRLTAEVRLAFDTVRHLADERGRRWKCPLCEGVPAPDAFCICEGDGYLDDAEIRGFYGYIDTPQRKGFGPPVEIVDVPALRCSPGACDDCAFRDAAPEQHDPDARSYLARLVGNGSPFHCHKGTLTNANGENVPLYGLTADGRPRGYPLCGGWVAARAAHIREVFRR